MTIKEWQKSVHTLAKEKGWYDGKAREVPELLCLIHSEVSEALEEYRTGQVEREIEGKPEGVGAELADAVIRCFDMAEYLGLDLEDIMQRKHAYNVRRPYRHGNKRA
jgi:NTP pyrophosphatase (non-canonical NTP hydrolase)